MKWNANVRIGVTKIEMQVKGKISASGWVLAVLHLFLVLAFIPGQKSGIKCNKLLRKINQ